LLKFCEKSKIQQLIRGSNRNLDLWNTSVEKAKANFEKWDRETPRSYREFSDLNLLHESVERFYRSISGKENAEDSFQSSYQCDISDADIEEKLLRVDR